MAFYTGTAISKSGDDGLDRTNNSATYDMLQKLNAVYSILTDTTPITNLPYTSAILPTNLSVTINNQTGALNFSKGATTSGTILRILIRGLTASSAGVSLTLTSGATACTLRNGVYTFIWDGTAWCGVGPQKIFFYYTATGASTFVVPYTGEYTFQAISGGASGGSCVGNAGGINLAGGGGGGGYAIFTLGLIAGTTLYTSVGAGGTAPAAGANNGNAGGATTIGSTSGGTDYISITGGTGGILCNSGAVVAITGSSAGGVPTFGANVPTSEQSRAWVGSPSIQAFCSTSNVTATSMVLRSIGGRSPVGPNNTQIFAPAGGAANGLAVTGSKSYGEGGGGGASNQVANNYAGAAGNNGIIIIEG